MLPVPYFPTAFAFASCYDSRTTSTLSPFSNLSIWRATRSVPMKDVDMSGWNILPKNPRFPYSFTSVSLFPLPKYHVHPASIDMSTHLTLESHVVSSPSRLRMMWYMSDFPFYLILTTVVRLAMLWGAVLLSRRHLSDTRIRHTCSGELWNDFLSVHQCQSF